MNSRAFWLAAWLPVAPACSDEPALRAYLGEVEAAPPAEGGDLPQTRDALDCPLPAALGAETGALRGLAVTERRVYLGFDSGVRAFELGATEGDRRICPGDAVEAFGEAGRLAVPLDALAPGPGDGVLVGTADGVRAFDADGVELAACDSVAAVTLAGADGVAYAGAGAPRSTRLCVSAAGCAASGGACAAAKCGPADVALDTLCSEPESPLACALLALAPAHDDACAVVAALRPDATARPRVARSGASPGLAIGGPCSARGLADTPHGLAVLDPECARVSLFAAGGSESARWLAPAGDTLVGVAPAPDLASLLVASVDPSGAVAVRAICARGDREGPDGGAVSGCAVE